MLSNFRGVPFLFSCFWICMLTKILRFLFQGLKCTLSGRAELHDCCVSFRNASLDRFGHQFFVASFPTLFFFQCFSRLSLFCTHLQPLSLPAWDRKNARPTRPCWKLLAAAHVKSSHGHRASFATSLILDARGGQLDEDGSNDSQIITLDKVNKEPVVASLTYVSLPWNHTVRLLFEATLGCINQSRSRIRKSELNYLVSKEQNFNRWLVNFRTKALWYRKLLGLQLGWFEKSVAEVPARRQAFEVPWFLRMCQEKGFFQISFCILKLNFAAQCTQDADSQFPPQSDRSREGA